MPKMTAAELVSFIDAAFPEHEHDFLVEEVTAERLRLRLAIQPAHLRPGNTIAGPVLMMLADTAMLLMVISRIGPEAAVVTSSLSINFLRKPPEADLIAEARPLKIGRRLAVGDIRIYSDGETEAVAQATVTYAIPGPPGA